MLTSDRRLLCDRRGRGSQMRFVPWRGWPLLAVLACTAGRQTAHPGADVPWGADASAAPAEAPLAPVVCTAVAHDIASWQALATVSHPGDTICLADGAYVGVHLAVTVSGTEAQPVVLTAEHPGQVVFSGPTQLAVGGAWAVLQGLRLQGATTVDGSLIALRNGNAWCNHCRLTESAIIDCDQGNGAASKWVGLYGQFNRVDHCVFSGKSNSGTLLVVWRTEPRADYDTIDHNLFAHRPPAGANGNEAIRIGTGDQADTASFTTVEDNLFEAVSGEAEIVSNKSGGNVYRGNTFRHCQGQLTLRNGSDCLVDANIFLADGLVDAGGIRVIGARHRVINNYVEGVRTSAPSRGGIVLMSGEANAAAGGYDLVQDAVVAFNTIVDCDQSLVLGADNNPQAPKHVVLANNLIAGARGAVVRLGLGLDAPLVAGNLFSGAPLGWTPTTGFAQVDPNLQRAADGLMRPAAGSPALNAAVATAPVATDLDEQTRTGALDVGADEVGALGLTRRPLTRSDVGPRRWSATVP
ncbi:MAG: hypothetical protein EXR77_19715 [Myxococcales bacterium]|nr:hypothetical protein [Myxococcales bacterium]